MALFHRDRDNTNSAQAGSHDRDGEVQSWMLLSMQLRRCSENGKERVEGKQFQFFLHSLEMSAVDGTFRVYG